MAKGMVPKKEGKGTGTVENRVQPQLFFQRKDGCPESLIGCPLEDTVVARHGFEGSTVIVHGAKHVRPGGHEDDEEGKEQQTRDQLSLFGGWIGRGRPRPHHLGRGGGELGAAGRALAPGRRGGAGAARGLFGDEVPSGLANVHQQLGFGATASMRVRPKIGRAHV